ncbi:hypothetical protein ACHQM5_026251 [Ranunculus cassubicifolius]
MLAAVFGLKPKDEEVTTVCQKQTKDQYSGSTETMMKVGPFGNLSNDKRAITWDEKGKSKLRGIYIIHGSKIHSIRTSYVEKGSVVLSEGSNNGFEIDYSRASDLAFDSIILYDPFEFLTSISGTYTSKGGICTITFGTNLRTYGPFGKPAEDYWISYSYSIKFEANEFFGFHGYSDTSNLRAIGVYVKPYAAPSTRAAPIKTEPTSPID